MTTTKKLRKDLRHLIEVQLDFMAFAYEIEEYESGNCILEHMDKNEPDILFLDIEMLEWRNGYGKSPPEI